MGRSYICKVCQDEYTTIHRHKTNNRGGRAVARRIMLRTRGITEAQYAAMLQKQNGVCAICHKPEWAKGGKFQEVRDLAVDHDHATNAVRGLLCARCNTAIGLFLDDPIVCRLAAEYLENGNKS